MSSRQSSRLWRSQIKPRRPSILVTASAVVFALLTVFALPVPAQGDLIRTTGWGGKLARKDVYAQAFAVDSLGRIYVADTGHARIARIETDDSTALSWKVASPDEPWRTTVPIDIAIDDDDHVYSLDQLRHTVTRYSSEGVELGSWTVEIPTGSKVRSIVFESDSIFILGDDLVRRYSKSGDLLDSWGGFENSSQWSTPRMEGDGEGNLLISATVLNGETATKSIYRFEPDGDLISRWSSPAGVYWTYIHEARYISGVESYYDLAPADDGKVWVVGPSQPYFFRKLGPSGLDPGGVGDAGILPMNFTLDHSGNFIYGTGSTVTRMNQSGERTGIWNQDDFPKYTGGDRQEGKFDLATDLTVRSDGTVGAYDPSFDRAQLFDSDGDFLNLIDGPVSESVYDNTIKFMLPDSGGVELFRKRAEELLRFSEDGTPLGTVAFNAEGTVRDITEAGDGTYAALSAPVQGNGRVTYFDHSGTVTGGFELQFGVGNISYGGAKIEVSPTGDLFISTYEVIRKYSQDGVLLASWWAPQTLQCELPYSVSDLAVDDSGNLFAALVQEDEEPMIVKFDPGLNPVWGERTGADSNNSLHAASLDIAEDGSLYFAADSGIELFTQTAPDGAPPTTSCPPVEEPVPEFNLVARHFGPHRAWVRLEVEVPEPGLITVRGRKVIPRSRRVFVRTTYLMAVNMRARFRKRGRKARMVKVPVRIGFEGNFHSELIETTVKLKVPARKPKVHHQVRG